MARSHEADVNELRKMMTFLITIDQCLSPSKIAFAVGRGEPGVYCCLREMYASRKPFPRKSTHRGYPYIPWGLCLMYAKL